MLESTMRAFRIITLCLAASSFVACDFRKLLHIPEDIASRQTVTFRLTNASSSDRFIATKGSWCDPYSVAEGAGTPVPLTLGYQKKCDAVAKVDVIRTIQFERVAAGASFPATWDARRLVLVGAVADCGDSGGDHDADDRINKEYLEGVHQPVSAGPYAVAFAFESTLPADCTLTGDVATCPVSGPQETLPYEALLRCPMASGTAAMASFTLPASGDISVPIAVP